MINGKRKFLDVYYGYRINKKHKKERKHKHNDDISSTTSSSDEKDDLMGQIIGTMNKKHHAEKIERDNNHIYFYSEVTRDSIYELCMLIREAEEECYITSYKLDIEEIPIYIHISSEGGSIYAAFSAIDVIKACKVPIYTIIDGATASAGTLISIMGEKRFIRPNSYMLIHQLSSSCWGKMSEIEDEFKNLQHLMTKITNFYSENTKIPKKELNELLKHDLWLDAEKSIKYGLADELWTK